MIWVVLFILCVGSAVLLFSYLGERRPLFIRAGKTESGGDSLAFVFEKSGSGEDESRSSSMAISDGPDQGSLVKRRKRPAPGNINISAVTRELIDAVMKMTDDEKHRLLQENSESAQHYPPHESSNTLTGQVVDMIMNMSLPDRCRILGAYKSVEGKTRRRFARSDHVTPVHFTVKGVLQNEFTKNISNSGVAIEALRANDRNLSPGDPVTLNLEHPRIRQNIRIKGRIARVTSRIIGVAFDKTM